MMINLQDFNIISKEIIDAIQTTFDDLRTNALDEYILFLAEGEYNKRNENSILNPYVIDSRIDRYKDQTRYIFLADFLSTFYSFPNSQSYVDDNEQRLHMELMIYTHIWESKPFLKKLYRLAHISNKEEYPWKINVPDYGKPKFIRDKIMIAFKTGGSNLEQIIDQSFHKSLRNAFAHSEYSFDNVFGKKQKIYLDNYNGKPEELKEISYDDWSRRFVYSALLSYHLLRINYECRNKIIEDLGTNRFKIKLPSKSGIITDRNIIYTKDNDGFSFER